MNGILFSEKEWHIFMGEHKEKAEADVRMLKSQDFKNKSIEDLAESICKKYQLEVPTLDMNEANWKKKARSIGDGHDVASFSIPFSGNGIFFYTQPPHTLEYQLDSFDAHDLQQFEAKISAGYCTLSFSIDNNTRMRLDNILRTMNNCLDVQKEQYEKFFPKFRDKIQEKIVGLKKQIENTERAKKGLGF